MSNYQIYVLILCLIVFALIVSLAVSCINMVMRLQLRVIDSGLDDQKILEEHHKKQNKKKTNKYVRILDYAFSGIVCLVLTVTLVCSLIISARDDKTVGSIPVWRIVNTGSMAEKNPKNTYLTENGLDDQIQTFDLICTEKLPDEMELEVYDIVVYEVDGMLIVHRIVEIEEPNESHPDCRYFRLQGDAVDSPDRFPVLYEQMRAIYSGDRIPFIGSFITFMQSPAGWLCTLTVVAAMVLTPILESILQKAKNKRLAIYLAPEPEPEPIPEPIPTPIKRVVVYANAGKMGSVNLGVINDHYNAGDVVDISSLKAKKLISKDCKRVKILADGSVDKALVIKADGFASRAVEMITEVGGEAIRTQGYTKVGGDLGG